MFQKTIYFVLVINSLDSTKSHDFDNVSVIIAKFCKESITIPLKIIFEESLKKKECFQKYGKTGNGVPVHKEEDKTLIKNCGPIY